MRGMKGLLTCGALLLSVVLAGCGDDSKPVTDKGPPPAEAGPDLTVDSGVDYGPYPEAGPDIMVDMPADMPISDVPISDVPIGDVQVPEGGADISTTDGPPIPSHGNCATPKTLTLTGGTVTESDDTSSSANEFGTDVSCGKSSFDGPQLYYKVTLTGGQAYKITLTPTSSWDPALYAFPASTTPPCDGTAIDAACTGYASDVIGSGSSGVETVMIMPATTEDWIVVADSWTSSAMGPFTLTIEEVSVPAHSNCSSPKTLTLTGGTVTESDDTSTALNEFGALVTCGDSWFEAEGPQLYYQVSLTGGTAYRVTMTPTGWDGALYAFPSGTACTGAAIDAGCTGHVADDSGTGSDETILLQPTGNEDWIVVVDSWSPSAVGPFSLTIEEVTVPANSTCTGAQAVTFTANKATVTGDTLLAPNEFGTNIMCGGSTDYVGNQLYYKVTIPASNALKLTLKPQFSAYLIVFSNAANCQAAQIDADCASAGATGDLFGSVYSGSTGTFFFTPSTAGDYIFSVDASSATNSGTFELDFELIAPPSNATCATAQQITLTNGSALVNGTTIGAANEFATLQCGGGTSFAGPQVYYTVDLTASTTYRFNLTPTFDGYIYLFKNAACTENAIETDCSGTTDGGYLEVAYDESGDIIFTPTSAGTYYVGVDSSSGSDVGDFHLFIQEHSVPTLTAPFTFNFDGDCNGLAGSLDWQCGALSFSPSGRCESDAVPPSAAHSGTGVWATNVNDCYSGMDNASSGSCTNSDTTDDSILKFNVSIPSGWTTATLTYWAWEDMWTNFDWGEIRIDSTTVASQFCASSYTAPTAWVQRTVDLSSYAGQTIEIAFHFVATSVVNYAGWYIDDLSVTGN
jgi:hypothetical protein